MGERDGELEMILHRLHRRHDDASVTTHAAFGPPADGRPVHDVMNDGALDTRLDPPLCSEHHVTTNVPPNTEVVTPGMHIDAEPPATSTIRKGEDVPVTTGLRRCQPNAAAADPPARPAVDVSQRAVDHPGGCPDQERIVHVLVTSATNARIRSSSISAS